VADDPAPAGPPVLTGPRIVMRPPRLEDAAALFAGVTSDPVVTEYLSWTPHPDVNETRRVITELFNVDEDHTWLIQLRVTAEVVGQCGYRRLQPHAVEVGYCLGRRWWGRGIMSEGLRLVLDELARDPALYRVSAACHVDNARSARVLERAGFSLEGRVVRYVVFPNLGPEPLDCLLFGLALR
jgi:ribosomal-protein-alanine N-acetyltransferase